MQIQRFIDGRFVDAVDGGTVEVLNPHDGSLITKIAAANAADVDLAVEAANALRTRFSNASSRWLRPSGLATRSIRIRKWGR